MESEYKVLFPDEEALGQYFAGKKDRLISVSDGWGGFENWCSNLVGIRKIRPDKPIWRRKCEGFWYEPEPYDYKTDMSDFAY